MVSNIMAGYNVSIFVYGQTGAGKTFTMMGHLADTTRIDVHDEQRGVALRVFEELFARCARGMDVRVAALCFGGSFPSLSSTSRAACGSTLAPAVCACQ